MSLPDMMKVINKTGLSTQRAWGDEKFLQNYGRKKFTGRNWWRPWFRCKTNIRWNLKTCAIKVQKLFTLACDRIQWRLL